MRFWPRQDTKPTTMKRLLGVFILAFTTFSIHAEVQYEIDWVRRYKFGPQLIPISDGFVVPINSPWVGGLEVVRLDSSGNPRSGFEPNWFGATPWIASAPDGGVVVAVQTSITNFAGYSDLSGRVTKHGGAAQWTVQLPDRFYPRTLGADKAGGYWVPEQGTGYNMRRLLKISETGAALTDLEQPAGVFGQQIWAATGGGFYIVERFIDPPGTSDLGALMITRFSVDGARLWTKPVGFEFFEGLQLGADGYFFGVARIGTGSAIQYSFFRRDADWNMIWDKPGVPIFGVNPGLIFRQNGVLKRINPTTGDITQIAPFDYSDNFTELPDGSLLCGAAHFMKLNMPAGTPQILIGYVEATYSIPQYRPINWTPASVYLKNPDAPYFVRIYSSAPGAEIFYTTDGTTPSRSSRKYTGEYFSYEAPLTLKAVAYVGEQILFSREVNVQDGIHVTARDFPGAVSVDPLTDAPAATRDIYLKGSRISVHAYPPPGWVFSHWNGEIPGELPYGEIGATRPKYLDPVFATRLTVNVTGGLGRIVRSPDRDFYDESSQVRFLFVPEPGYVANSTLGANPYTLNITAANIFPTNWTANVQFEKVPDGTFGLTVLPNGDGDVEVTPNLASYAPGQIVQISARARGAASFFGFSGTVADTNKSISLTMARHQVIWANFSRALPEFLGSALYIENATQTNGMVSLRVSNGFTNRFRIERSTNLLNWIPATALLNTNLHTLEETATDRPIFYRATRE